MICSLPWFKNTISFSSAYSIQENEAHVELFKVSCAASMHYLSDLHLPTYQERDINVPGHFRFSWLFIQHRHHGRKADLHSVVKTLGKVCTLWSFCCKHCCVYIQRVFSKTHCTLASMFNAFLNLIQHVLNIFNPAFILTWILLLY